MSDSHSGPPYASSETMTIAGRLRAARMAANKTQKDVAGDTYSKSYISAVERGKMTPSVQALGILAERLDLSIAYFLGEIEIDLSALAETSASLRSTPERERLAREEGLALMLCEAEGLIRLHEPARALERLGTEVTLEELSGSQRSRWHLLAGWAWLLQQQYPEAISLFEQGLILTERQHNQVPLPKKSMLAELAASLRCFLGISYYEQGQPELALNQHQRCLVAVNDRSVSNPELLLRIFLALGQDYLRLDRPGEAMGCYAQAQALVSVIECAPSAGNLYWDAGLTCKEHGDLPRAKSHLNKAVVALEVQENMRLSARLSSLVGDVLIHQERYDEAEAHLQKSLSVAQQIGDLTALGSVLCNLASLSTARGNYHKAIELARQGLKVLPPGQNLYMMGQLHMALASALKAQGDMTAAEQEMEQAITILEQTANRYFIRPARLLYGQFLAEQGRHQEAYEQMRILG